MKSQPNLYLLNYVVSYKISSYKLSFDNFAREKTLSNCCSVLPYFFFSYLISLLTHFQLLQTLQYELCSSLKESAQTNPIIGRIDCKSGHGGGRPTQKLVMILVLGCFTFFYTFFILCLKLIIYICQIDEASDRYSFMAKMLEAHWIE